MSTNFGWEGKCRYSSLRWQMNAGCAGKTVRSLKNARHTCKGKKKVKGAYSSLQAGLPLPLEGTHIPYGITQCYLPPGSGDIPAFNPAEAGTRFSDPGGM